jgi:hypothetical protein
MFLLIEARTYEAREVATVEESDRLCASGGYRLPTPGEQDIYARKKRNEHLLREQKENRL